MNTIVQIGAVVIAILGIAYIATPRAVYHFGFDSLRDTDSDPSDPSGLAIWLHRLVGMCLIIISISYLS